MFCLLLHALLPYRNHCVATYLYAAYKVVLATSVLTYACKITPFTGIISLSASRVIQYEDVLFEIRLVCLILTSINFFQLIRFLNTK